MTMKEPDLPELDIPSANLLPLNKTKIAMLNITLLLPFIVCLSFLWLVEEDHYRIEKSQSEYIGEKITIKGPKAYISGLEHCNDLPEHLAFNTKCIQHPKAQFEVTELTNSCHNCLDAERLTKPRRLAYQEDLTFTVIDSFTAQTTSFFMNLFNGTHNFLLLKDEHGRVVEMSEVRYELFKEAVGQLSREEAAIKSAYEMQQAQGKVMKTFCFIDVGIGSHELMERAKKMRKDFGLKELIELSPYQHCPPNRSDGFILYADDFNAYLTFQYYLMEWGVSGRWID